MKRIFSAVALAILSTHAAADFTGNDAWDLMKSEAQNPLMLGYVAGMMDAYRVDKVASASPRICPPQNATNTQAYDMLRSYLRDNPAIRDITITYITTTFYLVKWPCPKKAPAKGEVGQL